MDHTLQTLLNKELRRQQDSLELIASENYVSNDVLSAYSNVFTNKYSEGYPGARYYGGNEIVDNLETYTQELALRIFGLNPQIWGVNVQPLSGSVANLAVYTGTLNPGDTILAMDLSAGGHLTHGMSLNASGRYFEIISYGVDGKGLIDYTSMKELALKHKPKLIIAGFSSYPRNIKWNEFYEVRQTLQNVGHECLLMADIAHSAGLIAGGVLESPFLADFDIITTTTHKTLRGPRGALIYYSKKIQDLEKKINRGVFPGVQGGPFDHVLVAKAQAFIEILESPIKWSTYCQHILDNTKILAQTLIENGRTLATGGTENHMIVMDVTSWINPKTGIKYDTGLTGKTASDQLEMISLSVNKQLIPHDQRTPQDPSGIRIGTPAITTRGLQGNDVKLIAQLIHECLLNLQDRQILHEKILQLCAKYPLWY
ncbi:MAG TPA: serine hydroxymethyltransferase [Candidatus Absconditabacterales bacterium]|nr:serine hydroxymethyltransferase [Candidatus Absconditabacterales bacterium]